MEAEVLSKFSRTKENLKKFIDEYRYLKLQNIKLEEKIDFLSKENKKIGDNLKMLKKLMALEGDVKPIDIINNKNSIDMNQKIKKFVANIDECIAILKKDNY